MPPLVSVPYASVFLRFVPPLAVSRTFIRRYPPVRLFYRVLALVTKEFYIVCLDVVVSFVLFSFSVFVFLLPHFWFIVSFVLFSSFPVQPQIDFY